MAFFKKNKFYITTSIPYTNAPPHIGHVLEFIQADVLARYHKQKGEDVFFLTGTDEHGLKTKKAAEVAGIDLDTFLNQMAGRFQELKGVLNLTTDDFIRTTDQNRHIPAVVKLWETLVKNGDLYKKKYVGFYCEGCEAFKTEKELIDGKCVIHQRPVEKIEEENYFFKLSKYLPEVKRIIESGKINIVPESKKHELVNMISAGIEDVSFSRSKDKYAGIPVPGDSDQIIYVWADALPNYISALGYAESAKLFTTYWPADVHCIGKDILKFHAIYWPAMLLSLGIALPKTIFVHGHLTMNGQKISKSLGNVVDPFELVSKYGVDAVRYFLLREIPATEDGDFSYDKFETRYNADLAGGIGNLVARILGISKGINLKPSKVSKVTQNKINEVEIKYKKSLESFKFNEALGSLWELVAFCDKYINDQKLWETKKPKAINDIFFALEKITNLLNPFLPETSEKIKNNLKTKQSQIIFPRLVK